jgi:hypothetical protein
VKLFLSTCDCLPLPRTFNIPNGVNEEAREEFGIGFLRFPAFTSWTGLQIEGLSRGSDVDCRLVTGRLK